MGITQNSLNRLKPYLNGKLRILELGAQNLYDTLNYGKVAKYVFESEGFEHVSIDIIEHQGALKIDLREPFDLGLFDLVTNYGTVEHIDGPLYTPFLNIHNATKLNGIMIHENPKTGNWPFHGQHYFTMDFYNHLGYEVLELCEEAAMSNTVDGWNVCAVLRKMGEKFLTEKEFEKVYKLHIKSK